MASQGVDTPLGGGAPSSPELLSVRDLRVSFALRGGTVNAVDGVTFSLRRGEIVGLVGESGSGKSTLAAAVMRQVPRPGRIVGGEVTFDGRDMLMLSRGELRALLGRRISLIVQDALAAMNPVTTVEEQVGEVIRDHEGGTRKAIRPRVLEMLRNLQLRQPETILPKHAHELSGGMQQRVVIAGALILGPSLLVADEPTTALDVTVQAQILELLRSIRANTGTAILFITHDLATVAEICDRVLVMYAGQVIESGPIDEVYTAPIHPYTKALIAAIPPLGRVPPTRLKALGGAPPIATSWPTGCRFHPRCPLRQALGSPEICATVDPPRFSVGSRWATCHFGEESRSGVGAITVAPAPQASAAPQ